MSSSVSLVAKYDRDEITDEYFDASNTHYRFLEEDRNIIQSFTPVDTSALHRGKPYCCLLVRKRRHCSHRNMNDRTARALYELLSDTFGQVFVVGKDIGSLSEDERVVSVDLQTYASLISSPLCQVIVGTMTGTMQLAALLSQARHCLVMLNRDTLNFETENSPIRLGRCIRLSKSTFTFWQASDFVRSVRRELRHIQRGGGAEPY